ncbi:MAG: bifunctional aldolase/short-chain dehydrogenase [Planctomycetota bacterium]
MKSRWTDDGMTAALALWEPTLGRDFALRLYTARLLGSDPCLVLHGGGNVSFKGKHRTPIGEFDALFIKASGRDLQSLEPQDLPAVDLTRLRPWRILDTLSDEALANLYRTHLFNANDPTPSIETLLHAFLPHRYVDHSHPDALLAATNQSRGMEFIREIVDDRVGILPYIEPGLPLARAVAELYEANPRLDAIVLMQHGLLTIADDAKTAYARHIAIVDACEKFLTARSSWRIPEIANARTLAAEQRAVQLAPLLRGLLAQTTSNQDRPLRAPLITWRPHPTVLNARHVDELSDLASGGPLTTDHLIRTKAWPLMLQSPSESGPEVIREQLGLAIDDYKERYLAYASAHGVFVDHLNPNPTVILVPGVGLFACGKTKRDADIAADIAEHTLDVKCQVLGMGCYQGLSESQLAEMEFRDLQQAKLSNTPDKPLEGLVVVISGAAGAIGAAIAETCLIAGAHVALTDLDETRLKQTADQLAHQHGPGWVCAVQMDVRDETSVDEGYRKIVRFFGGVDVIVPNAGIAHVAPIENLSLKDFRRVMEVNAIGYFLFMREGIHILKKQGLGGHIIMNASKNVFAPGKDFGAYSASKAAGHQLGKVAALELAQDGIRVNMINADAVFGDEQHPSGLWAEVGPTRAKSRGMKTQDLPEYYKERNLLKARVTGRHVGNAVVFFASNATPTTGATLPVDGGIAEAFPR